MKERDPATAQAQLLERNFRRMTGCFSVGINKGFTCAFITTGNVRHICENCKP